MKYHDKSHRAKAGGTFEGLKFPECHVINQHISVFDHNILHFYEIILVLVSTVAENLKLVSDD